MADTAQQLTFLAWCRPQISTLVTGQQGGRAAAAAEVTLTESDAAGTDVRSQSRALPFMVAGPTDVTGLHPGAIVRRYPAPGTVDHESDRCPYIELADPTLPWRYTPAATPSGPNLHPWLVLLVGPVGELNLHDGVVSVPVSAQQDAQAVGGPADPYRYAHVQQDAVGHRITRVLSGRALQPGTEYLAVVVPAFDANGAPAWTGNAAVTLPVYDSWQFRTAVPAGSFEDLAARLHPAVLAPPPPGAAPTSIGRAPLTYPRLPQAPGLEVLGALVAPTPDGSVSEEPLPQAVGDDLARLRDTPMHDERGRPVIALPRYGDAWSTATPPARPPTVLLPGGSAPGGETSKKGGQMYERTEVSPMYRTAAMSPMYPTGASPMYPPGVSPMYPAGVRSITPTDMPGMGPAEKAQWARVTNTTDTGREKVSWTPEFWDQLDRAVHDEMYRVAVGRRFLPLVPEPDALTVPADTIIATGGGSDSAPVVFSVNEPDTTAVIEIWVEFSLTKQQLAAEGALQTAVTLATRAANLCAQGEDVLIFQGDGARSDPDPKKLDPLFANHVVQSRAGPGPRGLANFAANPALGTIPVDFVEGTTSYGENTFTAVADAYSRLQALGHYGPYVLVLPTRAYADAYAPLKTTLILTADRLLPLVEGRLYGTGTVPENIDVNPDPKIDDFRDVGVLLSLGGNTVDLVFGKATTTEFVTEDNFGLSHLRVYERFALREKDRTGFIALLFQR